MFSSDTRYSCLGNSGESEVSRGQGTCDSLLDRFSFVILTSFRRCSKEVKLRSLVPPSYEQYRQNLAERKGVS